MLVCDTSLYLSSSCPFNPGDRLSLCFDFLFHPASWRLQKPATSNNLEITKTELREVSDQILLTAHSWRQLQPGNWKILLKLASEELTDPKSALEEIIHLPHSKNAHFLTRHIVKEPIHICQSSVSDDQKVSLQKGESKQTTNKSIKGRRESILISTWHFFGDNRSHPAPFKEISTLFLPVVELILNINGSHFVVVPTTRRFDITAFLDSYSSEKVGRTSFGKSLDDASFFSINSYFLWQKSQSWNSRWYTRRGHNFFLKPSCFVPRFYILDSRCREGCNFSWSVSFWLWSNDKKHSPCDKRGTKTRHYTWGTGSQSDKNLSLY